MDQVASHLFGGVGVPSDPEIFGSGELGPSIHRTAVDPRDKTQRHCSDLRYL